MARRATQFATIRSEGGLLPSDLLARVARLDPSLQGLEPSAYWLDPGDRIAEAITRSWNRLLGSWETFSRHWADAKPDDPVVGLTRDRWLYPLLDELGWGRPVRSEETSHERADVPIHLLGANVPIDRRTANVPGAAKHAPHTVVQDLLNRREDKLWGLVSNGATLRLLRDNTSMTRQAFVDFDLEAMFTGEVYADFVVLWLTAHCSRYDAERPEACLAERWTTEAQTSGVRALAQLRSGVEDALAELGNGFLTHRSNTELRARLGSRELTTYDYYRQLLRLVYRLIFLFCAEDRGLLLDLDASPLAREAFAGHYSTARLRESARRRGTEHSDVWHSLRVVMRGLRDGSAPLGLPALGSTLWSDTAIPDLDRAQISNRYLRATIRSLAFTVDGRTLRAVDWRNLGSEELGSVYESLLELHPEIADGAAFTLGTAAGHERKVTGSYYTPKSLISELLGATLDPLLDERKTPDEILALRVCDPSCGSGHFLVAAAHRIARRLAVARTGEPEPSPDATRAALRDVIANCVYGIDQNAMAVELCKVSLWLEALEPGKPLSFLDHRIACGNSLLGTTPKLLADGIPDAAFKAFAGDDKAVATAWRKRNKQEREGQATLDLGPAGDLAQPIASELRAINAIPSDDIEGVREKERRWRKLVESAETARAKLVADAWCAAFVLPKVPGSPIVTEDTVHRIRASDRVLPNVLRAVEDAAERYQFLHWHLTFPDVFTISGDEEMNHVGGFSVGFDLVCGNPPWERVQFEERAFFASRDQRIAATSSQARRRELVRQLREDDPSLYHEWQEAKRRSDAESHFLRTSGRYPLTASDKFNLYAIFVEAALQLAGRAGSVGMVVKAGLLTDKLCAGLLRYLLDHNRLAAAYEFENRRRLFPEVDSRERFLICAVRTHSAAPEFVFDAQSPEDLTEPRRRVRLSASDFALFSPYTGLCPKFESGRAVDLARQMYVRFDVLGTRMSRGTGELSVDRYINVSDYSADIVSSDELRDLSPESQRERIAIYEGKLINQFDHRFASYSIAAKRGDGPVEQLAKTPDQVGQAGMHVPRHIALRRNPALATATAFLVTRDITNRTNERGVIAAIIPPAITDYTLRVWQFDDASPTSLLFALGVLNSFAFDWIARQRLGGTHLSNYIIEELPFPELDPSAPSTIAMIEEAFELTYTSHDLDAFASTYRGQPAHPFAFEPTQRERLRARLDAQCFHLFGLSRDDASYVLDTFPIVRRKDEAAHGEYRTKRAILEQYDEMARTSLV